MRQPPKKFRVPSMIARIVLSLCLWLPIVLALAETPVDFSGRWIADDKDKSDDATGPKPSSSQNGSGGRGMGGGHGGHGGMGGMGGGHHGHSQDASGGT